MDERRADSICFIIRSSIIILSVGTHLHNLFFAITNLLILIPTTRYVKHKTTYPKSKKKRKEKSTRKLKWVLLTFVHQAEDNMHVMANKFRYQYTFYGYQYIFFQYSYIFNKLSSALRVEISIFQLKSLDKIHFGQDSRQDLNPCVIPHKISKILAIYTAHPVFGIFS